MDNNSYTNVSNNVSFTKRRSLIIYNLFYKITYSHTPSPFLFLVSFIIKFWGPFLISHLHEQNIHVNSFTQINFTSFLRKLTFSQFFENNKYMNPTIYTSLCIIIYLLYSVSLILYFMAAHLSFNKTIENKRKRNIICWFLCVINVYCMFLLQHIVEILCVIIFGLFEHNHDSNIGIFMNSFGIRKYILATLNCLFIIVANFQTFLFMIMQNKPFLNAKYPLKFYNETPLFFILLFILFNFQGLHFITLIYSSKTLVNSLLLSQIIILIVILITYFNNYQDDGSFFATWFSLILILCGYSSFINVFLAKSISLAFHIESILLEIVASFITDYLMKKAIERCRRTKVRDMIFIAHKRRGRVDVYLTVVLFLKKFIISISRQEELYNIIEEHKEHCKAKKCLCCLFENVITVLSKEKDKLNEDSRVKIFLHLNNELIAVLGKEIGLLYEQIIRESSISRLKQITLLYVDFTFYFMSNINLGCFIVDKTLSKLHLKHKCELFFGFTLYKLKKENIKLYKKRLLIIGNDVNIQSKGYFCANRFINFWNIYKYQNVIFHLMRLIEKTTQKLEKVINYGFVKYIAESQTFNSIPQKRYLEEALKFNSIYDTVYTFYKSHKLLMSHLKMNFSKEHKLLNFKACYLTSLYFNTVCNEMPKDIISIFSDDNVNNLLEKSKYSFPETGFHYPFILNHDCDKNLSLLYICPLLAKKLGYKKSDVIEQDIKKFLPKIFWAPHQMIVQKVLFNTNIKPVCIDTFILNKNGNYLPCLCDFCHFPNLNSGLIIIMDIQLKINEHNTTYFVIDKFSNFITFSQNAEKNFYINDEIIEENKFNFLNFFGLNQSVFNDFKDTMHDIENRNIFFYTKNKNDIIQKNYTYKTKEFIYDKSKLKETFEKILFYLQDSQTYLDMYKKLQTIDILFNSFVEIDPNMFANINQYYSIIKNQLLLFKISLRKIDVLPFYVVEISHILPSYNLKHETCIYISSLKKQNHRNLHKSGSLVVPNNHTKKKSTMSILDPTKQKSSFFVFKNSASPIIPDSNSQNKQPELNVSVDIISNSDNINVTSQVSWSSTQNNLFENTNNDNNVNNVVHNKYLTRKELIVLYRKIKTDTKSCSLLSALPALGFFFFLIFHLLCLCLTSKYISQSQELFQLTHSVRTFEYMVILVSATFLDGCISTTFPNKTKNYFSEKLFDELIHERTQDMFHHLTLFQIGLSRMKLDYILKQFNTEETYYLLEDDWSIESKNSTLREIILIYHYYLDSIGKTISINKCDVYNYQINNDQLTKNITEKPTILEKLYVFILKNILGRIYYRITLTYNQINEISTKEYNSVLLRGFLNNSILFFFCVMLLVLFFLYINHYISLIIRIIELLISKKDHDVLYEKIKVFKSLAQDLCLYKDQKLKLSLDPVVYMSSNQREPTNKNEDKQHQYSLSSETATSFDGSGMGLIVMKIPYNKIIGNNSISKKQRQEEQNHKNKRKNKSILDEDIFDYESKLNNTDKTTSNMKNVISTLTNSQEIIKKRIMYSKYIKSSFTKLTLVYFWGIAVVVFETCIIIYSIFVLIQKSFHEKKSAIFGMNIVEKGNFYILLELSYKISILSFDPFLKEQYQLIQDFNRFKKIYQNENLISSYDYKFNSTFFGLFSELTHQSSQKVQSSKIDPSHLNIFHSLRYKNSKFETKDFCFYIVKYYFQLEQAKITSFEDFLLKSNRSLTDCRKIGEGINDNGISTALDSTKLHLTNNYVDFMKDYQSKNIEKIERYLIDNITLKMMHNLEYSIDKAHLIKITEIKEEIVYNYISWKNSEFIFVIVFILFETISLFSGSLFMRKLIIYYNVLYEVTGYIFNSIKE